MSDISNFESRSGKLSCTVEEAFIFVTDIRNFEQFIPRGTIENWHAERESASFTVSMLGTVSFRLAEKIMYNKIVINGDALKKNDFSLILNLSGKGDKPAQVRVTLSADLNPMLKIMASAPIIRFLEILIDEMENFRGWKDIKG
jgi:hypothetical protein